MSVAAPPINKEGNWRENSSRKLRTTLLRLPYEQVRKGNRQLVRSFLAEDFNIYCPYCPGRHSFSPVFAGQWVAKIYHPLNVSELSTYKAPRCQEPSKRPSISKSALMLDRMPTSSKRSANSERCDLKLALLPTAAKFPWPLRVLMWLYKPARCWTNHKRRRIKSRVPRCSRGTLACGTSPPAVNRAIFPSQFYCSWFCPRG